MELFKIKHKSTKEILFQGEFESFRDCFNEAIINKINLTYAEFRSQNFSYGNFSSIILADCDFVSCSFRYSHFTNCDLRDSTIFFCNLEDCTFKGCDFRGCNLSHSNLISCSFKDCRFQNTIIDRDRKIIANKKPIQITKLLWHITIFDHHMKIGCEIHEISEWKSFDDKRINEMNSGALDFWKKNKQFLLSACAANGRT